MRIGARWLLALLVAACPVFAQPKDVRQAAWGMTAAQVMATESGKPVVTQSNGEVFVRYESVPFPKLDSELVYVFVHDRLVRAEYIFPAEHDNLNDFIGDFQTVEPVLLKEYGKPADTRAIWLDDSTQLERKTYLDQDRATPDNILTSDALVGLAVSLGHLGLFTKWENPRTQVLHMLTGKDHHITHQIEFRSVEAAKPAK